MRKLITIIALIAIGFTVWGEEMTFEGVLKGNPGRWFAVVTDDGTRIGLAPESDGVVAGFNYAEKGIALGDTVVVTADFKINMKGKPIEAKIITHMEKK